MTLTDLRRLSETDKVVLAVYNYKKACAEHILSLDSWDPDQMAYRLSADRYVRFMKFMTVEPLEQFLFDVFNMMEDSFPNIQGLQDQDALRIIYWFVEAQLDLVKSSHHTLFEAHCRNIQEEQKQISIRKARKS